MKSFKTTEREIDKNSLNNLSENYQGKFKLESLIRKRNKRQWLNSQVSIIGHRNERRGGVWMVSEFSF